VQRVLLWRARREFHSVESFLDRIRQAFGMAVPEVKRVCMIEWDNRETYWSGL